LDQEAENVETIVLGERGKSRDGIGLFHISTNIERFGKVKVYFNEI
jgi:hypothetical protein